MKRIILGIRTFIVATVCVVMIKNFIRLLEMQRVETSIIVLFLVAIVVMIVLLFQPVIRHFVSEEQYKIVLGVFALVVMLVMLFLSFYL